VEPFGRKRIHGRVGLNVNGWIPVAAFLKKLVLHRTGRKSVDLSGFYLPKLQEAIPAMKRNLKGLGEGSTHLKTGTFKLEHY